MAKKVVDLTIRLKDGVSGVLGKIGSGISATTNKLSAMARKTSSAISRMKGGFSSAIRGVFNLKNAIASAALATPFLAIGKAVRTAFRFETLRTQIKVLTGSMASAKKVFDDLKEFSASTPFELPGIVAAWQQLKNFTGEALSAREGLELVGDAAAARGKDFEETATWVGRLYSSLKNKGPFIDSIGAMERMGIVNGELRGQLTKMVDEGASFADMWAVVEGQLKKFEGGMKDLSKTGDGLLSTLRDNWTIAVATFGDEFTKAAKGGITDMINTIKKLVDDGTITRWAEQAKSALDDVVAVVKILSKGSKDARSEVLGAVGNVIKAAFKSAAVAAVDIMVKYAPKIGMAIGKGVLDLVGIDFIKPQSVKDARANLKTKQGELSAYLKQTKPGLFQERTEGQKNKITEFYNEISELSVSLYKANKAWEDGVIELESVDLAGELKKLEEVINRRTEEIATPPAIATPKRDGLLKTLDDMGGYVASGAEKGIISGLEEANRKPGATTATATNSAQEAFAVLSKGLSGGPKNIEGSDKLIKQLMSGQKGLTRRQSLGVIRELLKNGGAGELSEAAEVMRDLTKGPNGLGQGDALKVIREMFKSGGIGDPEEIKNFYKQLTSGQGALSKKDASRAMMEIYGVNTPNGQMVGGPDSPASDPAAMANEYLKQIAENTKGGLF